MIRSHAGYEDAAERGDQAGMKKHGARFEQCEKDLVDMQREQSDLQEEKNIADAEMLDGLTKEELRPFRKNNYPRA